MQVRSIQSASKRTLQWYSNITVWRVLRKRLYFNALKVLTGGQFVTEVLKMAKCAETSNFANAANRIRASVAQ
jgi:hypothetical protein